MPTINSQLDDIHAMLISGQRSVRVEPHTLILWGLAGFFTILVEGLIITDDRFATKWHADLTSTLFYIIVLLIVGILDFRFTRRLRNRYDESLPFIHRQLRKVVYLLFGLIVISYLGMTYFGGWGISAGIYFALIGLGFYIYGLFSEQILSWAGILLIAMGCFSVAAQLSHPALSCLFGSVLGIGFPSLALILNRSNLHSNFIRRVLLSSAWLLLIFVPAFITYHIIMRNTHITSEPVVSMQEDNTHTGPGKNSLCVCQ